MTRPTPRQKSPELNFNLTDGTHWRLNEQKPRNFTLISFYRGLHCPVCKRHLQELQDLKFDFEKQGVEIVAVSMDTKAKAKTAQQSWSLNDIKIGYNLNLKTAINWGLYTSSAIKDSEPNIFSEPGLFLIDANSDVYYSAIFSNPWGRPSLSSFLRGIDYILKTNYPPRGEL